MTISFYLPGRKQEKRGEEAIRQGIRRRERKEYTKHLSYTTDQTAQQQTCC
jgi:hypothetical protein